jgi:hypothetical protein
MKRTYILLIFIFVSSIAFAQQVYQDVIYLKNGDIAKGIIIENVPNDYVKLETKNGSVITFKYADIKKFTKEKIVKEKIKQENSKNVPASIITNQNVQNSPNNSMQNFSFVQYSSISLGYGNSYGGGGVKFEYRFGTIAIHAGIGYFPPPSDYAKATVLFSGGVKFFISNKDFYLDIQFGTFGSEARKVSLYTSFFTTTEVDQKTLYGPSILLGNTVWFSNSIGLNGAIGASYNMVKIEWTDKAKVLFALDLGLTIRMQ